MFESILNVYGKNHTDEELIRDFNEGLQDEVIAYIYNTHKTLLYQTSKQFYGVDEFEVESIIFEQIWKCCRDYDASKSNGKLITMICTYVRNALRSKTQYNKSAKRVANEAINCDVFSQYETSEDRITEASIIEEYDVIELNDLIESLDLTENQMAYCKCAIDNVCVLTQANIAREIGVSTAGVTKMRRTLQEKLNLLIS